MLLSTFFEMVYNLFINMFGSFVLFFDTVFNIQIFTDFVLGEVFLMVFILALTINLFEMMLNKED